MCWFFQKKNLINRSSKQIDPEALLALSKGLNVAVTPAIQTYKDFVYAVEAALEDLPLAEAEDVRNDVVHLLKTVETVKPNLTCKEHIALKTLRNNESLTLLKADKGNAAV